MATAKNVKTKKPEIDRLRDEYVKAVGAVKQAQRMIAAAQDAYDRACHHRNTAQEAFIAAKLEAEND